MTKALLLASVAACALAGVAATSAVAQTTEQDAEESESRIETMVVTAQRREEDVQDVPISISAYGADFLEESNALTLEDISLYASNFTISSASSPTNQRIAIRGVGSVSNNALEPSVGVFIDGVYIPRSSSVIGNLIDLEAIEVLRGPQGTLFGRNTPQGALNIRTKGASRDAYEALFEAGAGSQSSYFVGGSVSGPITDNVAFRVSGRFSDREGFGDNLFTGGDVGGQEDLNIRGKLEFDVTPQLLVSVTGDYGKIESLGNVIELLNGTESAPFLGTLDAIFGPGTSNVVTSDGFDQDIFQLHGDFFDDEQWGLAVNAAYELGSGHTIRSITAYREWSVSGFEQVLRLPADVLPRITEFSTETFSQELQFLSPEGQRLTYLAGLFFYDEKYEIDEDLNLGADFCPELVLAFAGAGAASGCAAAPQIAGSDGEFSQDLTSFAVYGQASYDVLENVSVTLGGRYTTDDKTADYSNVVNNPFVTALGIRQNDEQLNLDADEFGDTDAFTYFANISYFPVDGVMLFATHSTGFKSGGFSSSGTAIPLTREQRGFAPEETTNYEVGIKSQLLNNTLQINATLFRMNIDDFQDRSFDGISLVVQNAGELRQQGGELDVVWAPLDQLSFFGALSYLDSEFIEYENASPLPGGDTQDLTGARNHFSPKWQSSLVADWSDTIPHFNNNQYFLRGELQYIGEQNVGTTTNQDPDTIQDAVTLFNAGVGLRADDDRWELGFFGRNLSDEGYCNNILNQPFGGPFGATNAATNSTAQRCVLSAPREWGIQLRVRH